MKRETNREGKAETEQLSICPHASPSSFTYLTTAPFLPPSLPPSPAASTPTNAAPASIPSSHKRPPLPASLPHPSSMLEAPRIFPRTLARRQSLHVLLAEVVVVMVVVVLLLLLLSFSSLILDGCCVLLPRFVLLFLRLGDGCPCCGGWPGAARAFCLRRRLSKFVCG